MKLFILGHRGWIGQKYVDYCRKNDISYCFSDTRADDANMEKVIIDSKATHNVSCIGRTHAEFYDCTD